MKQKVTETIISIGEVVWDIFGDKQVLGGAPVNVAYHLHSFGFPVQIITRVGSDPLGEQTREHIKGLGLLTNGIQEDEKLPTGQVIVSVDEKNEPHFDIVEPAAWDAIDAVEAAKIVGDKPYLFVFGTLAQRNKISKSAIRSLWEKAVCRFYDVNLRPPSTTKNLVLASLGAADIVKMNEKEIYVVAEWAEIQSKQKKEIAKDLVDRFDLQVVLVTEGEKGAWLMSRDGFFEHPGVTVAVDDTVGAGDAFFASFIESFILKRTWSECLARANHRGGYVASQSGATPSMKNYSYPDKLTIL